MSFSVRTFRDSKYGQLEILVQRKLINGESETVKMLTPPVLHIHSYICVPVPVNTHTHSEETSEPEIGF
jgi:hypothetical protein